MKVVRRDVVQIVNRKSKIKAVVIGARRMEAIRGDQQRLGVKRSDGKENRVSSTEQRGNIKIERDESKNAIKNQ